MSQPKIAIIIYSMYGHIAKLAEAEKKGIEAKGGSATIFQVPETLPAEVLTKMHAPAKGDYPIATPQTLVDYDAYLLGVPTRYGNMPAQWKTFWDATGQLWANGTLVGKHAGIFVSTAGPGGGQEMTALSFISTFTHHGILFVPFGYATGYQANISVTEAHGGSPWGPGTYTDSNGSRQPSERELKITEAHGAHFLNIVSRVHKA
ncbi:flavoprotein-like protein [Crepidotus variabilis]|uniref:Flavoprotein-like protein n=1 Tax=Crepidotus variabilis TaxID=179855 RepID=A0A9P6JPY0_9AGAR|nr:flavoprotein-like protein [Crepidotus variabilis]